MNFPFQTINPRLDVLKIVYGILRKYTGKSWWFENVLSFLCTFRGLHCGSSSKTKALWMSGWLTLGSQLLLWVMREFFLVSIVSLFRTTNLPKRCTCDLIVLHTSKSVDGCCEDGRINPNFQPKNLSIHSGERSSTWNRRLVNFRFYFSSLLCRIASKISPISYHPLIKPRLFCGKQQAFFVSKPLQFVSANIVVPAGQLLPQPPKLQLYAPLLQQ